MEREIGLRGGHVVRISQGEDGIYDGATIFDAGLVLVHYIAKLEAEGRLSPPLCGSTVIDIGSGTGVVGIAAAKLGAITTLSDLKEGQAILSKNIDINFSSNDNSTNCRSVTLKWGQMLEERHKPQGTKQYYDYVLGADITYILETFEDLVVTLSDLTNENSTIFISHELRKQEEIKFYTLAKQFFNVSRIPNEDLDETFQSEDIAIFKLTK